MPSTVVVVGSLSPVILALRRAWCQPVTFRDYWTFSGTVHRQDGATCRAIALKYGITIDPGC